MSTQNLCFRVKIRKNVYPCTSQFHYIKVGCKGVFITQTCLHDDFVNNFRGTSPETNSIVLWLVLGGFGAIFVLAGVKILWGLVGDGCCRRTISECCDSAGCSSTGEYFRSLYTPCAERMAGIGKLNFKLARRQGSKINFESARHDTYIMTLSFRPLDNE